MYTIQNNIEHINGLIRTAEEKFSRQPHSVQLLAVSKTKPIEALEQAIASGQRQFGENYVQEGVDKIHHFNEHYNQTELEWHFIGPIQSNKTRLIAENFDWVHSIDREKIAQRLNDQRINLAPLQVLIQVNTSGEASKSGIDHAQTFALAQLINDLPNLTLRGLMSIPENVSDYASQLAAFEHLKNLQLQLQQHYPQVDTLSMGMSGDMQAAIEAGSTMVRIGTAIFGERHYPTAKE
ncbi:YggS family pyridoxal phosphate-dependent enzyme [Vibrio sp. S11_S32]|uniref:YggS family pyridoxal phosphate-dependent enzyme n=1 Tax=Vibrio sp. S11_S32 TaxID=2720225 RepID=UPI0016812825|nr:YggS family pyridoxal phosphate-dependent enzyme [Vibrio sp. S11_S32]MBD1576239.1 YggS family pyridoxal phosphate-dependent enzyme [Vibrio sp. S11_S32]